ncbi:hypothetical protein MJO29_011146 [Puccinia striiformis f. sp. tritici]|nr:hypothetical protein Pst134EB_021834 [Puccinia striiformis f. sp. tritici]KAI7946619.1 hypothetical protein MJO29_011146 [Puccinia striiformis f. sp. tritici]
MWLRCEYQLDNFCNARGGSRFNFRYATISEGPSRIWAELNTLRLGTTVRSSPAVVRRYATDVQADVFLPLAVYCLTGNSNDEEEKCATVVKELERVKKVLKRCTAMSSILRRAYAVLDLALNKWARMKNRTMPVDGGPRKEPG